MNTNSKQVIRSIGNYYAALYVLELGGRYYWIIEDWDTDFSDLSEWEEIPHSLYDELIKFNNK